MIRLNSDGVHYLDPQNLRDFSNVTLISSVDKSSIKVNPMTLAALGSSLVNSILSHPEEEEFKVVSEFKYPELEMVSNFCMSGVLPLPMEVLEKKIPDDVSGVFNAFGISLEQVLFKRGLPLKQEEKIVIKSEVTDDWFEDPGDSYYEPYDDLPLDEDDDDEVLPPPKPKKRKRGRPRTRRKESESEDEEWTPYKNGNDIEPKEELLTEDEDYAPDEPRKPWAVGKVRKNMIKNYTQVAQELGHVIRFHLPKETTVDKVKLENYELSQPLDSYVKPPRQMYNSDLIDEMNRDKPVGCDKCPRRFVCEKHLQDHMLKFHYNHYDCAYCVRAFAIEDVESFRKHMFRHEHVTQITDPHECIQCGYSSYRVDLIKKHVKSGGPFHTNKCTQCPDSFASYAEHKEHVMTCHQNQWRYICGLCEDLFGSKEEIKSHRMRVHVSKALLVTNKAGKKKKIGPKVCDICGKEVYGLTTHRKMHHENVNENVACPECGKTYKSSMSLSNHIANVHEKVPCSICGEMVAKKRESRHFAQRHTSNADKKFKCKFCGKGFVESSRLKDHVNTHTGEKPYVCKFCGAAFASVGNHRMHERGHLGHKRTK